MSARAKEILASMKERRAVFEAQVHNSGSEGTTLTAGTTAYMMGSDGSLVKPVALKAVPFFSAIEADSITRQMNSSLDRRKAMRMRIGGGGNGAFEPSRAGSTSSSGTASTADTRSSHTPDDGHDMVDLSSATIVRAIQKPPTLCEIQEAFNCQPKFDNSWFGESDSGHSLTASSSHSSSDMHVIDKSFESDNVEVDEVPVNKTRNESPPIRMVSTFDDSILHRITSPSTTFENSTPERNSRRFLGMSKDDLDFPREILTASQRSVAYSTSTAQPAMAIRSGSVTTIGSVVSDSESLSTKEGRSLYIEQVYTANRLGLASPTQLSGNNAPRHERNDISPVRTRRLYEQQQPQYSRDASQRGLPVVIEKRRSTRNSSVMRKERGEQRVTSRRRSQSARSLRSADTRTTTDPRGFSDDSLLISDESSSTGYTSDTNTSGWVSSESEGQDRIDSREFHEASDDELSDLDERISGRLEQKLIQLQQQKGKQSRTKPDQLPSSTQVQKLSYTPSQPLHVRTIQVTTVHEVSDSDEETSEVCHPAAKALLANLGGASVNELPNSDEENVQPGLAKTSKQCKINVVALGTGSDDKLTENDTSPSLLFVPEEVADSLCGAYGGMLFLALKSGMTNKTVIKVFVVAAEKKYNAGYLSLSPDLRCGAYGSLFDIAVRSGCKVEEPFEWPTKKHLKRSRPFYSVRGGLYDMALKSGLSRDSMNSRTSYAVTTNLTESTRNQALVTIPDYIADYECGAKGTLYLATTSGFKMFAYGSSRRGRSTTGRR